MVLASAKSIKLTYFDIYGLAEIPRILLNYGDIEFEDNRFASADWPAVKPSTPLGVVPLLEIDGEVIVESIPIWNYLAREVGLFPKDNKDQLTTEIVVSICRDIFNVQNSWYYLPDQTEREAQGAQARKDTAKYLQYLEDILKKKGTGFFVGNSLTFADIVMLDCIIGYNKNSIICSEELYPNIAQNNANVLKNDKIRKYIESRPVCAS